MTGLIWFVILTYFNRINAGQGFYEKMGWSGSADPRRRQFEVKKGENDALKREIQQIESKRVEEHRDMTSDVGLELAPLIKAQPTGKPRKDANTGYMMDARLISTDITKHAAHQTIQPWHSRENKAQYWNQLTGDRSCCDNDHYNHCRSSGGEENQRQRGIGKGGSCSG